jgi:RNA polymerase sigma-70 factor (ECF subfamily)
MLSAGGSDLTWAGEAWTRRLAESPPEAIASLYDCFGPTLYRVACSMLGSPADAEDAVQEVFVGVVRGASRLGQVENLRAFLFTALRRAVLRLAQRRRRERTTPESRFLELVAPAPGTSELERAVQVESALQALPVEQREVIALKIDGDLTFAEIAEVLHISPNTAASRYRYALQKLHAMLEPLNDEAR